ncbi:MAG: hydroxymethylbilane synthase [Thermodesulfobacteriaceae bacterium]|nr:hydroxymethylbilane synthase [Thermodesulfobacteriaceae bacterium]
MFPNLIKVGTRGSKLALAQTDEVILALKKSYPELEFEKVVIKTTGDKILDSPLSKIGGKGLFVKEIEEALLREEIDLAVHSMKDVPTRIPSELEIAAIPKRESPFDVWISNYLEVKKLPLGSKVGTSSLRRLSQLKKIRKDLKVEPLRGNVDTRIRKWMEGQFDGIILAEAGLKRLKIDIKYQRLNLDEMIPAVGQGALGIEIHKEKIWLKKLIKVINCEKTALAIKAERAFLSTLEGGCQVPLGALAYLFNGKLIMTGFISDLEGERFYRWTEEGKIEEAELVGETLAKKLLKMGGEKILKELSP